MKSSDRRKEEKKKKKRKIQPDQEGVERIKVKWKQKKAEEKIEENKVLYMADGEGKNGRPHIKWRRKLTTNTAGEGGETVDNMKEAETGIETQKQNC